jgi:Transposase DDE domain
MVSISSTLRRIKQDLQPFLPERSIRQACQEVGYRWRQRLFDPVATLHLFILQILNFNTAITHLRHLSKVPINAASYCKARMRLPLAVVQMLLESSAQAMAGGKKAGRRWYGLRVYLTDASGSIAPDTPELQKKFPQSKTQKKGCGFPQVKILGLFDAFSGLVTRVLCFSLFHEQSQVWRLHPLLGTGDLLVADRGFCSYAHLAMLQLRGVLGLFRMHQRQIVDFHPHRKSHTKGQTGKPRSRYVKRLGKHDHLVRWIKGQRSKWMTPEQWAAIPASLLVRELRYTLKAKGQRTRVVTIATTLLDPLRYPKDQVAALYGIRWTVETHFAQLKTTLKMRKVKSQTPEGVQKEVAVYCLVYNLIHVVMLEAARRQRVDPGRISFIDTVRWLLSAAPGEPLPALVVNPLRPGRHEPRVIKDRQDKYKVMTRTRAQLRKALKKQAEKA